MTRQYVRLSTDDLGIDAPDYFPGYGVALSGFEYATVGVGDNPREAVSDALEALTQSLPFGAYDDAVERYAIESFYWSIVGPWRPNEHDGREHPSIDDIPDTPGALDDWMDENSDDDGNPPESFDDAPEFRYYVGIRWRSIAEPKCVAAIRDDNGKLPLFAFPGGARILYHCFDPDLGHRETPESCERSLCGDCANLAGSGAHGWIPSYPYAHEEGPAVECEHCGESFPAEYSDLQGLED